MRKDEIVFISFYTKDYAGHAKQLIASLAQHELRMHIQAVKGFGDWLMNVRWKPTFILRMMLKYRDAKALVWLDADARVHQYPYLLFDIRPPLGCRFLYWPRTRKVEIHMGTFFIRNTYPMRQLVREWVRRMVDAPSDLRCPEQEVLYQLLLEQKPRVMNLPEDYCHVLRTTDTWAVISQAQESRKHREPKKRKRLLSNKDSHGIHNWNYDRAFMRGIT